MLRTVGKARDQQCASLQEWISPSWAPLGVIFPGFKEQRVEPLVTRCAVRSSVYSLLELGWPCEEQPPNCHPPDGLLGAAAPSANCCTRSSLFAWNLGRLAKFGRLEDGSSGSRLSPPGRVSYGDPRCATNAPNA